MLERGVGLAGVLARLCFGGRAVARRAQEALHYGGQVGTEAKQTKMRPALLTGVLPKHADLLAFAFELKDTEVVELPARRQHGYEVF